jgi:hypothetical protein
MHKYFQMITVVNYQIALFYSYIINLFGESCLITFFRNDRQVVSSMGFIVLFGSHTLSLNDTLQKCCLGVNG